VRLNPITESGKAAARKALAAKKTLFPNVRRKRHMEALFGKNPYDISERLNPF
jgi:hypothetical protein